jgi:superfamily II DNA helicase RecQ
MNEAYPNSACAFSGKIELSTQRQICKDMENNDNSMLRLCFVTPEKIHKSKLFMSSLQKSFENKHLRRIVIDEAHCASQWG